MISVTSLSVKVGDLVIPAWRRLVEFLASLPVLPGVGVLITRTPHGTIVNARSAVLGFSGSWSIGNPGTASLTVYSGYCNAKVPTIGGKPIIPAKSDPRPVLKWKKNLYDKTGRSWVCLEAEVDASGKPIAKDPFRIVQAAHPYFTDKKEIGRVPLAVLYRATGDGYGQLHRIAYHDLQHRFDGKRHLFFI